MDDSRRFTNVNKNVFHCIYHAFKMKVKIETFGILLLLLLLFRENDFYPFLQLIYQFLGGHFLNYL